MEVHLRCAQTKFAAAGELAVKLRAQEVLPFAKALAERLVPILMAPTGSLPRSILENRSAFVLST